MAARTKPAFYVSTALNAVSLPFLVAMLAAICLTNAAPRHPIFINTLLVATIYSSATLFYDTLVLRLQLLDNPVPSSPPGLGVLSLEKTLTNGTVTMMVVVLSTLMIHLSLTFLKAFRTFSNRIEWWQTTMLLLLPYACSFTVVNLPVEHESIQYWLDWALVLLSSLTALLDGALLFLFFQYRKRLNRVMKDTNDLLSPLIRMSILCLFRFAVTIFEVADQVLIAQNTSRGNSALRKLVSLEVVLQHIVPLLIVVVFCQWDMIRVWFPFFDRKQEVLHS